MTLTKFMARSTWVAHAFEWEKLKISFEGKSQQEPRNWQMDRILIILKKENGPRASSAPALGLNTIIFKHVYWYMQQTQVSIYRTIGPLVINLANHAPGVHIYGPRPRGVMGKTLKNILLRNHKAQSFHIFCVAMYSGPLYKSCQPFPWGLYGVGEGGGVMGKT